MTSLVRRVSDELDGPTPQQALTRLTEPFADLPAPIGSAAVGSIALEERRETKARLVPLLVDAWLAVPPDVRRQALANQGSGGLNAWRAVAKRAIAGEDTTVLEQRARRRTITDRDDPRYAALVDALMATLETLTDEQLRSVFHWNSPMGLRSMLADLTAGVPVVRNQRDFGTPQEAEEYLAGLRAAGHTLVEPQIADLRQALPGVVRVSVGVMTAPPAREPVPEGTDGAAA